ncbi:MAG: energy transducer TonB [Gemmatimonadaceae bacterium]
MTRPKTVRSTRIRPFASLAAVSLLATTVACAASARPASGTSAQLRLPPADRCELARDDAERDPRLDVEKVPAPVAMTPAAIRRPVPRTALRRDGSAVIRVEVLVDTLGKPDMSTFAVVESSHAWFTTGAKNAIAKWTFTPAELDGCKVARYYQFSATSPARGTR